jgi:hypothetical protein
MVLAMAIDFSGSDVVTETSKIRLSGRLVTCDGIQQRAHGDVARHAGHPAASRPHRPARPRAG